jgi:hypothetical protein
MGSYQRTNAGIDQLGFVRGPARLLAAPLSQAPPANIGDIIKLTGSPTNEVQTLAISGTPTAGTFRLSFKSVTTATIAYNAAASAVQAALEGLSTIGTGNVAATGGPLPGSPVVLTFQGQLAGTNLPLLTVVAPAFTGGTTPAATVVETTPGTGLYDPIGSWFDLGATKNGVVPTMNNTEEEFTIDQQKVSIGVLPNEWTWSFTTSLAGASLCDRPPAADDAGVAAASPLLPQDDPPGGGVHASLRLDGRPAVGRPADARAGRRHRRRSVPERGLSA